MSQAQSMHSVTDCATFVNPKLVLLAGIEPTKYRPQIIPLDATALLDGITIGRDKKLAFPNGVRMEPPQADVASSKFAASEARDDDALNAKKVVSRNHVKLTATRTEGSTTNTGEALFEVWAEDLESSNGTWVDGKKLLARQLTRLSPGSCIQLGLGAFRLKYALRDAMPGLTWMTPNEAQRSFAVIQRRRE
jgi:pSer/pThr/pTyr-binding forkhead associated (FHA) protein